MGPGYTLLRARRLETKAGRRGFCPCPRRLVVIRWGFLQWAHGDLRPLALGSIAMHRKLPRRSRRAARLPAPTQAKGPLIRCPEETWPGVWWIHSMRVP